MWFLAPLLLLLLTAAAPPPDCPAPAGQTAWCDSSAARILARGGGPVWASQTFVAERPPTAAERPLAVYVVALASSEVYWNGRLIGRNGRPGDSRAQESPGRFVYSVIVPSDQVRRGANRLDLRLSSHHLQTPVLFPLQTVQVGPYGDALAGTLRGYLPALILGAGLALSGAGFAAAFLYDRSRRGLGMLVAMSAAVVIQLSLEVLKAFYAYPYTWHLPRLAVIAVCAGLTGVLAARYAAWRFAPTWQTAITRTTVASGLLCLLLLPGYDIKAGAALLVGLIGAGVCAIRGLRANQRTAWAALAAVALALGLIVIQGAAFLDSGYYIAIAAVFAALLFEQFGPAALRAAAASPASPQTLAQSPSAAPDAVVVMTGRDRRLVAVEAIRAVRAADDYCEVLLTDGRVLLHTAPLARILEAVPSLRRVHRSHAVNPDHVVGAKAGDGLKLILDGLRPIPVGRTYRAQVEALLATRGL